MSYTMTMKELGDTQRVRRMCVGNSDPIFVSGENGEEQMVLLDAGIFRELYARHQIHRKIEESERDFAEGRHQDAYEMLTDVFAPCSCMTSSHLLPPKVIWRRSRPIS